MNATTHCSMEFPRKCWGQGVASIIPRPVSDSSEQDPPIVSSHKLIHPSGAAIAENSKQESQPYCTSRLQPCLLSDKAQDLGAADSQSSEEICNSIQAEWGKCHAAWEVGGHPYRTSSIPTMTLHFLNPAHLETTPSLLTKGALFLNLRPRTRAQFGKHGLPRAATLPARVAHHTDFATCPVLPAGKNPAAPFDPRPGKRCVFPIPDLSFTLDITQSTQSNPLIKESKQTVYFNRNMLFSVLCQGLSTPTMYLKFFS